MMLDAMWMPPVSPTHTTTGSGREPSEEHVPHPLYRHRLSLQEPLIRPPLHPGSLAPLPLYGGLIPHDLRSSSATSPATAGPAGLPLPAFVKPLPQRLGPDEIQYLERKGALTIPPQVFRNELLEAYVQFVHPFMPCIQLHDFLHAIEGNGSAGQVSLLLFQSVMFAGIAFVDMKYLKEAGYATRRQARKHWFTKARVRVAHGTGMDNV